MSRNPDLITLRNGQYNRSRRSRALKRLDITLIKVGGGSNPNFLFFLNKIFFSFDVMTKQIPYRYSADAKEIIQNTHEFCKREKEDGLKISLNQVKVRASTATGVSKSMVEQKMRGDNATEQKPQLTRGQLFKASLA